MSALNKLKEISIEVTNKCSQHCLHCSSMAAVSFDNELSLKEIKDIVSDAKKLGADSVVLSGGDPLSRGDIKEIIDFARGQGLSMKIETSGIYNSSGKMSAIDPSFLDFFSANLRPKDIIVFSCLGMPETHEKITTVKNSFNYLLNSIKEVKNKKIPVGVNTVVHSLNYNELIDLYKLLNQEKIDDWHLLRLVKQGRCEENYFLQLTNQQFKELQAALIDLANQKSSTQITIGHNIDRRYWLSKHYSIPQCLIGNDRLLVRANGDVAYCPALKYGKFGNIRENNLHFFWQDHPFVKAVRNLIKSDPNSLKGKCHNCDLLASCKGGCVAQRLHEFNDDLWQGPDPMCFR
jgi:radical SAM protein with 4Fe4S-binding SPASM domain